MLKKKLPNYNKVSSKTWSHFDFKKKKFEIFVIFI